MERWAVSPGACERAGGDPARQFRKAGASGTKCLRTVSPLPGPHHRDMCLPPPAARPGLEGLAPLPLPAQKVSPPALSEDTRGRPSGHQAQATADCVCLGSRSRAATAPLARSHMNTVPSADPAAACCSLGLRRQEGGAEGGQKSRAVGKEGAGGRADRQAGMAGRQLC